MLVGLDISRLLRYRSAGCITSRVPTASLLPCMRLLSLATACGASLLSLIAAHCHFGLNRSDSLNRAPINCRCSAHSRSCQTRHNRALPSLNSREGSAIQRVTGKEVRVTLQSSPARLVTIICAQPIFDRSLVLGRQRAAGAWRFGDGEATRPDGRSSFAIWPRVKTLNSARILPALGQLLALSSSTSSGAGARTQKKFLCCPSENTLLVLVQVSNFCWRFASADNLYHAQPSFELSGDELAQMLAQVSFTDQLQQQRFLARVCATVSFRHSLVCHS